MHYIQRLDLHHMRAAVLDEAAQLAADPARRDCLAAAADRARGHAEAILAEYGFTMAAADADSSRG